MNTQIINLLDTIETTRDIVKLKMGREANNSFNVASRTTSNQQNIADTFNNYFLSITDSIDVNKNTYINSHTINDSSMQFMSQIFMTP